MFTHSNQLLAVVIIAILALWGCQKDWMNGNSSTENPQRISESNSEKQARRRFTGLFPNDNKAAKVLGEFKKLLSGTITTSNYGNRGVDTAIWVIEAYANYEFRVPAYEYDVVKVDSIELSMNLIDSVTVDGGQMVSAYNTLRSFILAVPSTKIETAPIAADVNYRIAGNFVKIMVYVTRVQEVDKTSASSISKDCRFKRDDCLKVSLDDNPLVSEYGCSGTTAGGISTTSWVTRKAGCSPRPQCVYYTDIETDVIQIYRDDISTNKFTFPDATCICGDELNDLVRRIQKVLNRNPCKSIGKELVSFKVDLFFLTIIGSNERTFVLRITCGRCRQIEIPIGD